MDIEVSKTSNILTQPLKSTGQQDALMQEFQRLNRLPTDEDNVVDSKYWLALRASYEAYSSNQTEGTDDKTEANAAMAVLNHHIKSPFPTFYIFELPVGRTNPVKFIACVEQDGQLVVGNRNTSKPGAKQSAALALVRRLGMEEKVKAKVGSLKRQYDNEQKEVEPPPAKRSATAVESLRYDENEKLSGQTKFFLLNNPKNPVSILNEFLGKQSLPTAKFEVIGEVAGEFVATCQIPENESAVGVPSDRKQSAKLSAARVMLDHLIRSEKIFVPAELNLPSELLTPVDFKEFVRHSCYSVFYTAIQLNGAIAIADPRMAGCVMTNTVTRDAHLVSWACGSYAGPSTGNADSIVRDCDALVLCKRGLQKFLYRQLVVYHQEPKSSIFYCENNSSNLKLRPSIDFHFFATHSPKLNLNGTQLLDIKAPQRAKISSSMSTIDKMMKWNVVGVQGAVLSTFIDPVYITTYIFNDAFDKHLMEKAVVERIPPLYPLKSGYQIHEPIFESTETNSTAFDLGVPVYRAGERASVNWNAVNEKFELLSCYTGLKIDETCSSLSRVAFYSDIAAVHFAMEQPTIFGSYGQYKQDANNYKQMMNLLKQNLATKTLGVWVNK
ncbi:A to I editase domain-containing protein [Aphelenchoides besseyi]|nr:A to I editase domain-containing protein [Aphelenchoides besseyi]KAI6210095.1 A to I editase domain-containing protein [Aphelenchoides besseyi]